MKIQYFSDVHLEYFSDINEVVSKIEKCADVCVIAGDIGYPWQPSYSQILEAVSKIFQHVVIIHGNHEYYQTGKTIEEIKTKTREICSFLPNVHYLDNSYIDLKDDRGIVYRFIGTTLWSHISKPQYTVNDRIYIKEFTVENNNETFRKNVEYLETTLENSKDTICIVVTHHMPSFSLVDEMYKQSPYNQCFASNCDKLIKDPVKAWIFGHTHKRTFQYLNGILCTANPIGYPGENKIIDFNETIEIP